MEHLGGKSSIYTHLEISENKISIGSTPQPLLTVTTGLLGFGNPLPRLHPGGATDPKKKTISPPEATFLDGIDFETNARLLGRYAHGTHKELGAHFLGPKTTFRGSRIQNPTTQLKKIKFDQIWF